MSKNLKKAWQEIVDYDRVFEYDLSLEQRLLGNGFFDDLKRELDLIRDSYDLAVFSFRRESLRNGTLDRGCNLDRFPIGSCHIIRDAIISRLKEMYESQERGSLMSDRFFRRFIEQGGVFKEIFGIQDGVYFQNAIQIGSRFVDVANDTVDVNEPKVVIDKLKNVNFKNVSTLEEYVLVSESYQGVDIYPNVYFPALSPIFPLICFDRRYNIINFGPDENSLHAKNILSLGVNGRRFEDSRKFLFDSEEYIEKRLPNSDLDLLREKIKNSKYSDLLKLGELLYISKHEDMGLITRAFNTISSELNLEAITEYSSFSNQILKEIFEN